MRAVKRGSGSPVSSIARLLNMLVEWCRKRIARVK